MARIKSAALLSSILLACAGTIAGQTQLATTSENDVTAAVVHCVSDASGLRAALAAAAVNGQHDVIQLVRGTYPGHFAYRSYEAFNLTIAGGYTASCSSRAVDPANTVLDGMHLCGKILKLESSQAADIVVEGLTLQGSTSNNCAANQSGGGLWASTAGGIVLSKTVLADHWSESRDPGGAYLRGRRVQARDNTVDGTVGYGAMVVEAVDVDLRRNTIRGSYTYFDNSSPLVVTCPSNKPCKGKAVLVNNLIEHNDPWDLGLGGGGAYIRHDQILIDGNIIQHNSGNKGFPGIKAAGSEVVLTNNIVTDNSGYYGCYDNEGGGGADLSGELYIVNNTIVGNMECLWYEEGVVGEGGLRAAGPAHIYNNIIFYNHAYTCSMYCEDIPGGDLHLDNHGGPQVHLYNNDLGNTYIAVPFNIDRSNLVVDPLLVDACYLQPTSPVINKGSNAAPKLPRTDLEGNPRILLGMVDMGAREAGAPRALSPANGATEVSLQPMLTWVAGPGATSYDVYFGARYSPAFLGNTTGTSFAPGKLTANKIYHWRVVAHNGVGTISSPIWTFQTGNPAPAKPSPANGATGVSRTPTLTWTAGVDAASHDVYFGLTMPPALVTNTTGASYNPGTLKATRKYYWKVVAKTSTGVATSSPIWSFTTK